MGRFGSSIRFFRFQVAKDGLGKTLLKRGRNLRDKPLHAIRTHRDIARDKRICGMSLEENVISPFAESHGVIDTIHTPYGTLEAIFGPEQLDADDVVLDVGCGLGRPLAYLVDSGFQGKIEGVEINPPVAERAMEWAARYPNVNVVSGDAMELPIDDVTVFFMWVPMTSPVFRGFVEKIEAECRHSVRLLYLSDTHDGDWMDARQGWTLYRRQWIQYVKGLPQHGAPQRFSAWRCEPRMQAE